MQVLIEIYHRLLEEKTPSYNRYFYDNFKMLQRFVGVTGARGVGKTTFLLEYLRRNYGQSDRGLYVSADHLYFSQNTLLDTAGDFVKQYDGKLLCIDEIHKYKNWNQELKNIYDIYPKLKVIFSGSSSIDLVKGKYDLSRRAYMMTMYGFSFREYLEIKIKRTFPILKLEELVKNRNKLSRRIMSVPKLLGLLKDYWKRGYYPTTTEIKDFSAYQKSLLSIIEKSIYEDISSFYSLKTSSLDTLKRIIYFISTSQPGSLNINKLSKSLGRDNSTIAGYIQIMRDGGLLRFLLNDKYGHALVRNAEKIYLDNPNLLHVVNDFIGKEAFIGALRELFVISSLQNSGYSANYTEHGDIKSGKYVFEIGGKDKKTDQLNKTEKSFVVKDDVLSAGAYSIPLYLFGFLS